MTAEEVFDDLSHKYGEDFNWHMLPFTNKTFVAELKNEIGEKHFYITSKYMQLPNVIQMMMCYLGLAMKKA